MRLNASDERYRLLFELSPDGIATFDIKGVVSSVNPAFLKLTGFSKEELVGKNITQLEANRAQDLPKILKSFSDFVRGKIDGPIEFSFLRKDGTLRRGESRVALIKQEGKTVGIQFILRDITERKKAELEIGNLARFPSENPSPVLRIRRDGVILYANAAFESWLEKWKKKIGEPVSGGWMRYVKSVLGSGVGRKVEFDHEGKVFSFIFTPVVDAGYVNVYGRDITERKLAEKNIDAERRKFTQAIETSTDLMGTVDLNGNLTYVNKAFEKITGYKAEEVLGKSLMFVQSKDQTSLALSKFREIIEKGSVKDFELDFISKNKQRINTLTSGALLTNVEGKPSEIFLTAKDITERKKTNAALLKSESRFRELTGLLPSCVFEVDLDGNITYINQSGFDFFGFSQEDFENGIKTNQTIVPEEFEKILENRQKIIRGEQVSGLEYTALRKDGTTFSAYVHSTPIKHEGEIVGLRGILIDITERKKIEDKILQQTNFYTTTINALAHPFYVVDAIDYTIQLANSASRFDSKLKGLTCHKLIHSRKIPCAGSGHICPLEEVKKTKKPVTVEHVHYDKDGNSMFFEVHGYPIFNNDGNVIQMIEYSLDITDRKQAEVALRDSEERFKILFEFAPDAMYLNDLKGNLVEGNKVAEEITGYTRNELIGKSFLTLKLLSLEQIPKAVKLLAFNVRGKSTGPDEFILNRKDGTQVPVEIRTFPVKIKDRKLVLGIARDITERKRIEDKLKQYSEHLEALVEEKTRELKEAERMATIGETAGMVGHDLRNPLQAIVNTVYLANMKLESLPDKATEKEELKVYLNTVDRQVNYMNKIVSDLLDYARPIHPEIMETSMHQLIQDILLSLEIPETIKVSEVVPKKMKFEVDTVLMRRVLINLITNSIQAMPDGGKLEIKASKKAEDVFISVKDTGVGIREEDRPKLFQPLFTTKSKGQGFGLPVCKRIVDAHGGVITVKSKVGEGTTVTVIIPQQATGK